MASFLNIYQNKSSIVNKRDDLPPESLTKYYNDRKKILFGKIDKNKNEDICFNLIKESQKAVNDKFRECENGGFFKNVPSNIYNLSQYVKENIANYSLIFSLYFMEGEFYKSLKLFLLMCEQNRNSINYLTSKIIESLQRISNSNKIAQFYPTITKTMLQVLAVFIKLSGKFHKSTLGNFYITLYLKITHLLSITVIKYNPGNSSEINNQLKNERKYFYSSCLFDSSIYLFNRYQPLSIIIYILQHILELYGTILTFNTSEKELVLLLKVNYNLGLFYYMDGHNYESINHLIRARDKIFEMKYFPTTPLKNIRTTSTNEENSYIINKFSHNTNSSSNLIKVNELMPDFNKNIQFSRNKNKRTSLNSSGFSHNNSFGFEKQNLFSFLKDKNINSIRDNSRKISLKQKQYSTIYLGVSSLLNLENPIILEEIKEKLIVEIELLLSEIELNHKNYRESLNHISIILNMNSKEISNNNAKLKNNNDNDKGIIKSKTVNSLIKSTSSSTTPSNGISELDENKNNNKFMKSLKVSIPSDSNLIWVNKNNNNKIKINSIEGIKLTKYQLTFNDKNRLMKILEEIENANNGNQNNISDSNMYLKNSKNLIKRNESLNKDKKIINSKEMEKFFIFICSLSIYQIKILNESQPEPSQRRNDLPIIFNNQFQDCLTNAQRMSLSVLETMSLTRYIILKDTNKDICPENLDYRFMKYRLKETDSDEDNSYKLNYKSKTIDNLKKKSYSIKKQFTNTGIHKLLEKKKFENEFMEDNSNINLLLKEIKSEENIKFINAHKNSILKLLRQMTLEEQRLFLENPKLLKKIINKTSKKYEEKLEENGGDSINVNNNKHVNFSIDKNKKV